MPYYPETTLIRGLVRIQRERRLPSHAVPQPTHTLLGSTVEAMHTVLQGDILREYRILDIAAELRLRDPAQAAAAILVRAGQAVQAGQELARRGKGRRARVVVAPAPGQVVQIEDYRLILQLSEQTVEVLAKMPGEVQEVSTHAVQIATVGALIECAWGNGGFAFATFRFLPEDGFVSLSKLDVRISEYRRVVVVHARPLTRGDLLVAQQQEVGGVVAPSMPSHLREFAMQLKFPVLLTEGFGQRRPTSLIYTLLHSNMGRQAAFNAAVPERWSRERPEIIIQLPPGGVVLSAPALVRPLEVGSQVRITRAPWDGMIGEVLELPATPQVVDSGLRVLSARVQLPSGRVALVPLANLELFG